LLDFVMRLPRNNTKKNELRDLAATLMPREMAYRAKIYQSVPIGHWFRGPLKEFLRDQLSPSRVRDQGLLDPGAVQRLIDQHLRNEGRHGMKLWALVALAAWHDVVLRKPPLQMDVAIAARAKVVPAAANPTVERKSGWG
jgi:asparagine synthase (glutamine-hydrolysing)